MNRPPPGQFTDSPEPRSNGSLTKLQDVEGVRLTATTVIAIIGLLSTPVSFYVNYSITADRQLRHEEQLQQLNAMYSAIDQRVRSVELRTQRTEDTGGQIALALNELKLDVREIKQTMTRTTRRSE